MNVTIRYKGGIGSGHHGHAGRPGKRGGSTTGAGGGSLAPSNFKRRDALKQELTDRSKASETYGKGVHEAISIYQDSTGLSAGIAEVNVQAKNYGGDYRMAMITFAEYVGLLNITRSLTFEESSSVVDRIFLGG